MRARHGKHNSLWFRVSYLSSVWWSLLTRKRKLRTTSRVLANHKAEATATEVRRMTDAFAWEHMVGMQLPKKTVQIQDVAGSNSFHHSKLSHHSLREKSRTKKFLASNPFAACAPFWLSLWESSSRTSSAAPHQSHRLGLVPVRYHQEATPSNSAERSCCYGQGPEISTHLTGERATARMRFTSWPASLFWNTGRTHSTDCFELAPPPQSL